MKEVLTWVKNNPQAVKSFLAVLLAWIGKIYLASTGKAAAMGAWGDVLNQGVDVVLGLITFYGVISGVIHTSRGPSLTDVDQAATIVASMKGPPISVSIAEVKTIAGEVTSISPTIPVTPPEETSPPKVRNF